MESYEKRTWWSRHRLTERLADDAFLEAAVTVAFLIAAADGHASEAEYDALLDRLEILGGVDRDKIDELLTHAASRLEQNGFAPNISRIARLLESGRTPASSAAEGQRGLIDAPEAADAALMLGLAIGLADDDFSSDEQNIARQIAAALRHPVDFDAMIAELRG